MLTNCPKKSHNKFYCESCDYFTRSKKDYHKHILTRKHQNAYTMLTKSPFRCHCGRDFLHRQSLHRHKKVCDIQCPNVDDSDNMEFMKQTLNMMTSMMKEQQQQNKELSHLVHQNHEQQQLQVIDAIKNVITINNNTNCNNNNTTFNMNVFLNETCKDAMNLDDFVNSLQLDMDDLLYTAENGFVEGVGKILLRGLENLSIEKRPIHCSDMKREVMYIKRGGVWEKDTDDNSQLRETILLIGRMNVRQLPPWMKANPNWFLASSRESEIHASIILNAMVEDAIMGKKYANKVVKNVAKKVHVNKHVVMKQ
jgi:hypothetical protein